MYKTHKGKRIEDGECHASEHAPEVEDDAEVEDIQEMLCTKNKKQRKHELLSSHDIFHSHYLSVRNPASLVPIGPSIPRRDSQKYILSANANVVVQTLAKCCGLARRI